MATIEQAIAAFSRQVDALESGIHAEQRRAKVYNPADRAYPLAARAMRERWDNLRQSIRRLHRELAAVRLELNSGAKSQER